MQRPEKIKDGTKIHATARELHQHGLGNSVWASSRGQLTVGCIGKKITGDELKVGGMKFSDQADLRQLACSSAMQSL